MSTRLTLAALAGALFVAGSASAGPAELQAIEAQCLAQLGYPPEQCACIAERAGQQLDNDQQKFMVAYIAKDEAAFNAMQSSMPKEQMAAAGQFMTAVPDQCN